MAIALLIYSDVVCKADREKWSKHKNSQKEITLIAEPPPQSLF